MSSMSEPEEKKPRPRDTPESKVEPLPSIGIHYGQKAQKPELVENKNLPKKKETA